MAPAKKVNKCPQGGLRKLREKMVNPDEITEITCQACLELFKINRFDKDRLREILENAANPDAEAPKPSGAEQGNPEQSKAEQHDKQNRGKEKRTQKKSNKRRKKKDESDSDVSDGMNDENCKAVAKEYEPHIVLLEPGSHGKKYPYQCLVCKTAQQPDGKIGELGKWRPYSVRTFLEQHASGPTHKDNVEKAELGIIQEADAPMVPCEGLSMDHPEDRSVLHAYKEEFTTWASFANFQETAVHSYWKDPDEHDWRVRARQCLKEVKKDPNRERQVCKECLKLCKGTSIVRAPLRFAQKYWDAKLLHARLFEDEAGIQSCIADIKELPFYREGKGEMGEHIELSCWALQQVVQGSFACDPFASSVFKEWKRTVVDPCLRINVKAMPEQLQAVAHKVALCIETGQLPDATVANLKIALAAISGGFDSHPLLLGLALQCKRLCEKRARNIDTMRGRRSNENAFETAVIADAGLQLALLCGNKSLAREMGLSAKSLRISLSQLKVFGLPTPALALMFEGQMEENFALCDRKFQRGPDSSKCALDILGHPWNLFWSCLIYLVLCCIIMYYFANTAFLSGFL